MGEELLEVEGAFGSGDGGLVVGAVAIRLPHRSVNYFNLNLMRKLIIIDIMNLIYFNLNILVQFIKLASELKEHLGVTPSAFSLFFLFSSNSLNPSYPFSPLPYNPSKSLFVRAWSNPCSTLFI